MYILKTINRRDTKSFSISADSLPKDTEVVLSSCIKECRQVVADLKTAILNVYETSVEQHNTSHAKAKTNISKMCDGTALRIEQELLALIDNLRLPSAWEPSSNAS